jgi:hypothetical protein
MFCRIQSQHLFSAVAIFCQLGRGEARGRGERHVAGSGGGRGRFAEGLWKAEAGTIGFGGQSISQPSGTEIELGGGRFTHGVDDRLESVCRDVGFGLCRLEKNLFSD